MKIACQSCPAKYTIADDKVVGKIVKIRCKKCNATIVVNGNEAGAAADDGATALYQGSQDDVWTVNVAEGDQRTMTTAEVIDAHRAGVVNDETYLWKDGMDDWLPIREVDAFAGSLAASEIGGNDLGGLADLGYDEPNDERTLAAPAGVINAAIAAMGNAPSPLGSSSPAPAAGTPAAARRAGGRGAGGDLFGGAASAGAEDEVLTSAGAAKDPLAGGAAASAADDKLTGQRNENSVLFSLGSLTGGGNAPKPAENKTTAEGDASGLIDIRALAATMGTDSSSKSSNKVDDIMNLGGGGAFGAALAAPVLTAPPLEANPLLASPALAEPAPQKGGGKGLMFGMIGLGVAIVAAAAIVVLGKKDPTPTTPTAVASGTTAAPTTGNGSSGATTSGAVATNDTNGGAIDPTKGPAPVGGSSGATGSSGKATGSSGAATGSSGTAAASSGGAATTTTAATTAAPTSTKPLSLEEQMRQSASGGTGSSGGSSSGGAGAGPFDRGAAAAALGAIAGSVGSCKKADGPTGAGHVTVTFAPNGSVKAAVADSAPYQGTAVGGCVAGKFRGAHIPPFSGSDQAVGKSFSIN